MTQTPLFINKDVYFYNRNIRDINTIYAIKDDKIYLNYSKIFINLNNDKNSLRYIIVSTRFKEDFIIYCQNNNINFNSDINFENINDLVNNSFGVFFKVTSGLREIYGTYGPSDFIDMLLVSVSSEYRRDLHRLMNSIQNLADSNNESFRETLERTIEELQRQVEELNNLLEVKEEEVSYLNSELNDRDDYIEELEEDLYSSNEIYDETVNNYESTIERMDRRYEELLRRFEEAEFNANERYYKNKQESDIKTNKLLDAIQGNTKNNLNRKVTNPIDETKKCFLRVTVDKNYKNLPENSFVTLTVNRTQKRNLKPINLNTETILLEENVANSIELYNNFIDKSDINFIRTPTGININVTLINTFINELKKYIRNENSRGTSEVLTSEVGVTIENNLILYEDVLRREFYIDHRYRSIYLSETNQFYYNKINRPPTFITLENLIGCLCRINNEPSKRVKRIELIKGRYVVVA